MVFGGLLVEGREIRLGALTFIADDSAWLQEAPLDVDALLVRGAAPRAFALPIAAPPPAHGLSKQHARAQRCERDGPRA